MHRKFGKKDVIFIGALLGICLIVLGVWYFAGGKQGASVVVTREGEVYGTYSLSQPQTVKIKNSKGKTTNVLVIRDGKSRYERSGLSGQTVCASESDFRGK